MSAKGAQYVQILLLASKQTSKSARYVQFLRAYGYCQNDSREAHIP